MRRREPVVTFVFCVLLAIVILAAGVILFTVPA